MNAKRRVSLQKERKDRNEKKNWFIASSMDWC